MCRKFFLLIFVFMFFTDIVVSQKQKTCIIVGKTGVGKSSLINFIAGKMVARVNQFDIGTIDTTCFEVKNDIKMCDTRGFGDGYTESTIKIQVRDLVKSIGNINLFIIVYDLDKPRWESDDSTIFDELVDQLSPNILTNTLFVFTKKNLVQNKNLILENRVKILTDGLQNSLKHNYPSAKYIIASDQNEYSWQNGLLQYIRQQNNVISLKQMWANKIVNPIKNQIIASNQIPSSILDLIQKRNNRVLHKKCQIMKTPRRMPRLFKLWEHQVVSFWDC